jgi:hypothetical protein
MEAEMKGPNGIARPEFLKQLREQGGVRFVPEDPFIGFVGPSQASELLADHLKNILPDERVMYGLQEMREETTGHTDWSIYLLLQRHLAVITVVVSEDDSNPLALNVNSTLYPLRALVSLAVDFHKSTTRTCALSLQFPGQTIPIRPEKLTDAVVGQFVRVALSHKEGGVMNG